MAAARVQHRGVLGLVAIVLVAAAPAAARGQGSVLLQGIADGEFWSTNARSNLLTRNDGQLAGLGRLQLWGAMEVWPKLVAYAQGTVEAGSARYEPKSYDVSSDQF